MYVDIYTIPYTIIEHQVVLLFLFLLLQPHLLPIVQLQLFPLHYVLFKDMKITDNIGYDMRTLKPGVVIAFVIFSQLDTNT